MADTIDFKLLERLPTKNPDSLRELLHEVEQPVDRRLGKPPHCPLLLRVSLCLPLSVVGGLAACQCCPFCQLLLPFPAAAGNVTPLNNADKEALKQRLDTLDQRRVQQHAASSSPAAPLGASSSTAGTGSLGPAGAKATAAAAAPGPPPNHHQSLTSQWLPALHTAQLNKQKQKAEQKRLTEQHARAQQRAALVSGLQLHWACAGAGTVGSCLAAASHVGGASRLGKNSFVWCLADSGLLGAQVRPECHQPGWRCHVSRRTAGSVSQHAAQGPAGGHAAAAGQQGLVCR